MKRLAKLTSVILISSILTACAGTGLPAVGVGIVVTDTTEALDVNNGVATVRTGEACAQNILGILANGDSSVQAAKSNAGITRVATMDRKYYSILGVYAKVCTVVKGS